MNEFAPKGSVFVCLACGKRSRDRYGERKINKGWDESCMMYGQVFKISQLVVKKGRVVRVV